MVENIPGGAPGDEESSMPSSAQAIAASRASPHTTTTQDVLDPPRLRLRLFISVPPEAGPPAPDDVSLLLNHPYREQSPAITAPDAALESAKGRCAISKAPLSLCLAYRSGRFDTVRRNFRSDPKTAVFPSRKLQHSCAGPGTVSVTAYDRFPFSAESITSVPHGTFLQRHRCHEV